MPEGLVEITASQDYAVLVQEAAEHAKIEGATLTAERGYIELLIRAAIKYLENQRDETLTETEYEYYLEEFPSDSEWVEPPRYPLRSVTSITYTDEDGATQTLSTDVYDVDTKRRPGRIFLKFDQSWPSTREIPQAVKVTFKSGYGPLSQDVPAHLKLALFMIVAHWYENREPVAIGFSAALEIPFALRSLIDTLTHKSGVS